MKFKLLLLSICCSTFLFAQDFKMKWGKITQEEVDIEKVEFDSSAQAVILSDYGRVSVKSGEGVNFDRYRRIKILAEGGVDEADIAIPYVHEDNSEFIRDMDAQIINIVDGKPVIDRLSKKDFFRVKINDRVSELRFTLPKVAVGSIIEYRYTSASKSYLTLESWNFQNKMPTLHSYLKVLIDSHLYYSIMYQGRRLIDKYANKETNIWELHNLPGVEGASFCPNPGDFTEKVKFQLNKYYSNGMMREVMKSWEDVTHDLITDSEIKTYLNKDKDARKMLVNILDGSEKSDQEKIAKIYNYLTHQFDWSGTYWYYPSERYADFIESKTGNSVEINLLFVNLLNAADIEAHPAMLSTKRNGFISKDITFFSQFNALIACAVIDDKNILLDATSPLRPYNLLDQEYLNTDVLVIRKKDPYWLKIQPHSRNVIQKMVEMKMTTPGVLNYDLKLRSKGYEAEELRYEYLSADKESDGLLLKEVLANSTECKINTSEILNFQELDKTFGVEASIDVSSNCVVNDDFIYINPFIDAAPSSNPFNDKQRYLPVDLYYPFEEMYFVQFEIPEGYEVIEVPESANIMTDQSKCKFNFDADRMGNKINMRLTFKVEQPFFSPYEYPALRELYDRYLEKRQEQIVLKRVALTD